MKNQKTLNSGAEKRLDSGSKYICKSLLEANMGGNAKSAPKECCQRRIRFTVDSRLLIDRGDGKLSRGGGYCHCNATVTRGEKSGNRKQPGMENVSVVSTHSDDDRGLTWTKFSWCFEPSQPHMPGLKTKFSLCLGYSTCKSWNHQILFTLQQLCV